MSYKCSSLDLHVLFIDSLRKESKSGNHPPPPPQPYTCTHDKHTRQDYQHFCFPTCLAVSRPPARFPMAAAAYFFDSSGPSFRNKVREGSAPASRIISCTEKLHKLQFRACIYCVQLLMLKPISYTTRYEPKYLHAFVSVQTSSRLTHQSCVSFNQARLPLSGPGFYVKKQYFTIEKLSRAVFGFQHSP